jgi:hypothetical protein
MLMLSFSVTVDGISYTTNMRVNRIYLLLACSTLIPACAIPGDAPWSDLHVNAYAAGFTPTFKASAKNIDIIGSGATPELSGSFTVDSEKEFTNQYGARIGFAPLELSVSQFSYSRNQTGLFGDDGGGHFGGVAFTEGIPVNSTLDIDATKMMVGLDIVNTSIARVGLLAGIDVLRFNQFSFQQQDTGSSQDVLIDQEVPVPIIGVRGDVALPGTLIRLGAEITGVSIDVDEVEASFFDIDVNFNMEILENGEAVIGYRAMNLKIDGSIGDTQITDMDLSISGPYFGVSVYF